MLAILRRARAEGADWYTETLRVAVETRARCAPRRGRPVPQTPGAPRVEVLEDGTLKVTARSWLDTERRHAAT